MPETNRQQHSTTPWMNRVWATVESVQGSREGVTRVLCRMPDGSRAEAVAYPVLCGEVSVGSRVLLNTTAVDLRLGTGGDHFIIAVDTAPPASAERFGHIVKMRYTPLQAAVLSVEEPDSPHHEAMREADSLFDTPVVCCELLSQAPAVMAGLLDSISDLRIAIVVTDEAAIPVLYSEILADLRDSGMVKAVISTGQAYGGDLEAVNFYSGLLAAKCIVEADAVIVTPGPGTVGTNTRWGFGGVRQGEALNAVHALGGRPVAVVRASSAESRPRHLGISHHSRTVFTRVANVPFSAAWPSPEGEAFDNEWDSLVHGSGGCVTGYRIEGTRNALERFEERWKGWTTMGRTRSEDVLFFAAAAAAGVLAQHMLEEDAT